MVQILAKSRYYNFVYTKFSENCQIFFDSVQSITGTHLKRWNFVSFIELLSPLQKWNFFI